MSDDRQRDPLQASPFRQRRSRCGGGWLALSLVAATLAPATAVNAQGPCAEAPLVVIAGQGELPAEQVARQLTGALTPEGGHCRLGPAADDLERAAEALGDEVRQCVLEAIRAYARGEASDGDQQIARCRRLVDRARTPLLFTDASAVDVLDACLVEARGILMRGEGSAEALALEARSHVRFCRSEVPATRPTAHRHTEDVNRLLDDVDAEVARSGGVLLVRHEGADACEVRVNSRPLGRAPATARLPDGRYNVSLHCPDAAVAHEVVEVVAGRERVLTLQPPPRLPSRPGVRVLEGSGAIFAEATGTGGLDAAAAALADELGAAGWLSLFVHQRGYVLRVETPGSRGSLEGPTVSGVDWAEVLSGMRSEARPVSPGAASGEEDRQWALWVGGLAIPVGLAVGILPGAIGDATTGCIVRLADGACSMATFLDVGASVAWGLVGAAIVAAGIVLIVHGAEGGSGQTTVRLGPMGLALEGSF